MARPDFGQHVVTYGGAYPMTVACAYIAPGLTFADLCSIFHDAEKALKPGDELSGNPAVWPNNRGIYAVAEAILTALYPESA